MNILFYRYGSICEPDMIETFKKFNLNVIEEGAEITNKQLTASERILLVENHLKNNDILFVFGINYYPPIAELCRIYKTMYITWTVDSPILTLFSESIKNETNRIFMFDRMQYERFKKYNPDNIFHLPLASATERFDRVINSIVYKDRKHFASDISFVGSLYNEKDPYSDLKVSDFTQGYIDALIEASMKIYGYYHVKDALNERIINDIKNAAGSGFPAMLKSIDSLDEYAISHEFIGNHIAVIERERTLNKLAEYFKVDLYTRSNASRLINVNVHEGVRTLDEMPKVFNISRINLNITMRPIESGLPLRCFDILGCGGFLMTNYQEEIPEYFEIGKDLETYSSLEELVDKCAYYLSHEDERAAIANNGRKKVKQYHTYDVRLKEMLSMIL